MIDPSFIERHIEALGALAGAFGGGLLGFGVMVGQVETGTLQTLIGAGGASALGSLLVWWLTKVHVPKLTAMIDQREQTNVQQASAFLSALEAERVARNSLADQCHGHQAKSIEAITGLNLRLDRLDTTHRSLENLLNDIARDEWPEETDD